LVAANLQKRKVHRFTDPKNIIKKDRQETAQKAKGTNLFYKTNPF